MITVFDLRTKKIEGFIEKIESTFDSALNVRTLEEKEITPCIGCWSCWIKTPGKCCFNDVMTSFYKDYVNSEKVVLLMDTAQGFINHTAKAFFDRTIPHYHPYIDIVDGECHHKARYKRYPELYFYFDSSTMTNDEEAVTEDYLFRTAYHFQSPAYRIIEAPKLTFKQLKHREAKRRRVPMESFGKPQKLIIYNGSPRLKQSNTELILSYVQAHVQAEIEIRDLKQTHLWEQWSTSFSKEDYVIFALPLYVHAMPSHVMAFIEKLPRSQGGLGFIVQSGFPESSQSYYLEAVVEQIVLKLGRKYMGIAIKGGVEGLNLRPEKGQIQIMKLFADLIEGIAQNGVMSESHISQLAGKANLSLDSETLPESIKSPDSANFYWDMLLEQNQAFDKRFDMPYKKD